LNPAHSQTKEVAKLILVLMRVAYCNAELRDDEAQESEVAPAGLTSGQIKLLRKGTIQYKGIMQLVGAGLFVRLSWDAALCIILCTSCNRHGVTLTSLWCVRLNDIDAL
jgi:hypothetical protein